MYRFLDHALLLCLLLSLTSQMQQQQEQQQQTGQKRVMKLARAVNGGVTPPRKKGRIRAMMINTGSAGQAWRGEAGCAVGSEGWCEGHKRIPFFSLLRSEETRTTLRETSGSDSKGREGHGS